MEQWATKEEIIAGLNRLEAGHPGWERPAAYAVGVHRDGGTAFTLTNVGERILPAIALGLACGHTSGTATYPLNREQLADAIANLAPAAACTTMEHPNYHHWVALAAEIGEKGGQPVAVFVGDLDDAPVDEHDRAFRAAIS